MFVGWTDGWLDIILFVVATIMQLTGIRWMDGWMDGWSSHKAHYFFLLLDHLVSTCRRWSHRLSSYQE